MKRYSRLLSKIVLIWIVCGCTGTLPTRVHNLDLNKLNVAETDDLVLTRRVVLESGQASLRSIYVFGTRYRDVTATSDFGAESEIANVNCMIAGLRDISPDSNIISTADFWKAIGDDVDTINLAELFSGKYAKVINDLNLDYLIIAYQYLIDKDFAFHEDIIHGGYTDTDCEVAAAVSVDMRNKRLISAAEVIAEHVSMKMHILVIPFVGVSQSDERPCVVAGKRVLEGIRQSLGVKTFTRIAVVAATNNPYSSVSHTQSASEDQAYECP